MTGESCTGEPCTGEPYLQSAASGHGLVRVQRGAQLLAEEFADSLFDGRDSGGPAHNLQRIDVFLLQLWMTGSRRRG